MRQLLPPCADERVDEELVELPDASDLSLTTLKQNRTVLQRLLCFTQRERMQKAIDRLPAGQ